MSDLRTAAQQALDSINELFAAEQSEGGERGGHIRTPARREHLVRVAQARKALHESCGALRAALAQQAAPVQEKNSAPEKLPVPKEWYTEPATTCFAKSYNGEGSYYCPHCDTNAGSVWVDHAWRPTKWQAICYNCRNSFNEQG